MIENLKNFVRKEASRFLKQKNITSIGIGYKHKDGKEVTPRELSIQFTVASKVKPEGLESVGATEIPRSFVIDGVEVLSDVLQRSYAYMAREVDVKFNLENTLPRKSVVNPIVPGVSIGHTTVSAGTAGCVVYDTITGKPYILSNWHVLNGPTGEVGDYIVQPGRHDDNRIERNIVGSLVRSYLGVAGDCAVASIDRRYLKPDILGLDVAVEKIGEPELGDIVVKSGRTTDVTYGIVNRIHTVTRINYDSVGDKEIGCFEIGPYPDKPAANNQISMGGDSGSVWLWVKDEKPTNMMLGLHFAGEVGDEPDHALACYSASVFEKLGISPKKIEKITREDIAGTGYSEAFLDIPIKLPTPSDKKVEEDLLEIEGRRVFDYMHFSLAMSSSRRFARWVAWNIDGGSLKKLDRKGIKFKYDPNIPEENQAGDELYDDNVLDRGHIARRADLLWGTLAEAKKANKDSFFFTNITPQHEAFNQSGKDGIWGQIEDAIFNEVKVENLRISVMGGPIFSDDDPDYRGFYIPKEFFKIIYFKEEGNPIISAKGYVLTQKDLLKKMRPELFKLPEFLVYEVPIEDICAMTGLNLPSGTSGNQPELEGNKTKKIRCITSVQEILG